MRGGLCLRWDQKTARVARVVQGCCGSLSSLLCGLKGASCHLARSGWAGASDWRLTSVEKIWNGLEMFNLKKKRRPTPLPAAERWMESLCE